VGFTLLLSELLLCSLSIYSRSGTPVILTISLTLKLFDFLSEYGFKAFLS
jgi:hypothetical protein